MKYEYNLKMHHNSCHHASSIQYIIKYPNKTDRKWYKSLISCACNVKENPTGCSFKDWNSVSFMEKKKRHVDKEKITTYIIIWRGLFLLGNQAQSCSFPPGSCPVLVLCLSYSIVGYPEQRNPQRQACWVWELKIASSVGQAPLRYYAFQHSALCRGSLQDWDRGSLWWAFHLFVCVCSSASSHWGPHLGLLEGEPNLEPF